MSELGEDFRAQRQESQARRAENRRRSTERLLAEGIIFTSHNDGAHLIVRDIFGDRFDFWPGTGKWHKHNDLRVHCGRGVASLIKLVKGRTV